MIQKVRRLLFENKSQKQTIAKNTFWGAFSQIVGMAVKGLMFLYFARLLGVSEYGRLNYAISFVGFFSIFADLGTSTIFTREISSGSRNERAFFDSFLSLKLVLSVVSLLLCLIFLNFFNFDFYFNRAIYIFSAYNLATILTGVFSSYFSAKEKMEYNAYIELGSSVLTSILAILFLYIHKTTLAAATGYLASSVIVLLATVILFRKYFHYFSFRIIWNEWKYIVLQGIPLAVISLFGTIYSNVDIFMIGAFLSFDFVGQYSAAYKLILLSGMPTNFITASFFPAISRIKNGLSGDLKKVIESEFEVLIFFGTAVLFGGYVLAPKIIDFIYDQRFINSIPSFRILLLTVYFIAIYSTISQLLVIFGYQKRLLISSILLVSVNAILDYLLIPRLGIIGAAIASASGVFILLISLVFFSKPLWREVNLSASNVISYFFSSLISGLAMFFQLNQSIFDGMHVILSVLLGAIFYFAIYFIFIRYIFKARSVFDFVKR